MRIGVLGAGLMGKEAVRDLLHSDDVVTVHLADINKQALQQIHSLFNSNRLTIEQLDVKDTEALHSFIQQSDVIINALLYTFNEIVAKEAIEMKVHYVDLGGHIGNITNKLLTLNDKAKEKRVTLIPDLGVAPGMTNILAGYGASKLHDVQTVKLYVGGIPRSPKPPLEYYHLFSMEGVLDHYTDPSYIIRDGEKKKIASLSEIERIDFDNFNGLEAFHTSGGTSTLLRTFQDVQTLEYKTIRYKGHAEKFKLLVDLNLTRRNYYIDVNGEKISPRDVLLKILEPIVKLGAEEDVVLVRVVVSGKKNKKKRIHTYETVVHKDTENNITAMARTTATTISIVAQMVAKGTILKRGVIPPEIAVPGEVYIDELKARGIRIKHIEQ